MSETGRAEQQMYSAPVLGLRTRGEPGQATVNHSTKLDNFILGKGSLKSRLGLKKVTASRIKPPSLFLESYKSSWLRLRTNDITNWPDFATAPTQAGSYGVSFRAKLHDIVRACASAEKEIHGWDQTHQAGVPPPAPIGGSSSASSASSSAASSSGYSSASGFIPGPTDAPDKWWGPQELFDKLVTEAIIPAVSFIPGPIVCLAATTDVYHVGVDDADGISQSTGWAACLVQNLTTSKWYPILLIFARRCLTAGVATDDENTFCIVAPKSDGSDPSIDPFVPHNYMIQIDNNTQFMDSRIYFRVDDQHIAYGADLFGYYHFIAGDAADNVGDFDTYFDAEDMSVFFGGSPDVDHYTALDVTRNNPLIWEFSPSTRQRMTNPIKNHIPAHISISEICVWDTVAEAESRDYTFDQFWTNVYIAESYDNSRIDRTNANTLPHIITLWNLDEDRGHPIENTTNPRRLMDVLSTAPIRELNGWSTGVHGLRFGGMSPLVVPNGDLYREQFGGIRGTFGCLYPRDHEGFFIYWKIDSINNPDEQVVAAFISPQNTTDGLYDQATWGTGDVRGFCDRGTVHWGLKLVRAGSVGGVVYPIGASAGDICLVFFARGREFESTHHLDETIKQCNTAVYGVSANQYVNLGAQGDAVGKRLVFTYSRVSTWSEADAKYSTNTINIIAHAVDGYTTTVGGVPTTFSDGGEIGVGTLDLSDGGDAHYIHSFSVLYQDDDSYNDVTFNYGDGKSLIPTWLSQHMGLKKYYLVVGGFLQQGWSGPEDLTDIRGSTTYDNVEPSTFRNEEIDYNGLWAADVDKLAGMPEDNESWMGIPEQGGGLQSYRFNQDHKDNPVAITIGSVDRSRITSVSSRCESSQVGAGLTAQMVINFAPVAPPNSVTLTFGPPNDQTVINAVDVVDAADFYNRYLTKHTLRYVMCALSGNNIEFMTRTAYEYNTDTMAELHYASSGGTDSENWIFEVSLDVGVNVTFVGVHSNGNFSNTADLGDPHFHLRHTILGAIGVTCGFGYVSSTISDADALYLATEGYVTDGVKERFADRVLSIWDCQEDRGGRLVDVAGSNTISDQYLFPITACPKALLHNTGDSTDLVELDIHHDMPWGLYAYTERYGIRREESLFTTETGSSEVVGLVETRKRTDQSRQYVVASSGVYEIVPGTGNGVSTYRHIGRISGDIPENTALYSQRWGSDIYFTCGAGRPMKLTAQGDLVETGQVEFPRIWWNDHYVTSGVGSQSQSTDVDFYCHGKVVDGRGDSGELDIGVDSFRSGSAGIFHEDGDLHVSFPTDNSTEPILTKQWPDPGKGGFSYAESYHAALVPKAQTAPNLGGPTYSPTPMFDMPPEENVKCQFYWFITGVNKNHDPPLETPRGPVEYWNRAYADPDDETENILVGFFTKWFGGDPQASTYAKLIYYLSKSPSPDITHIKVYRTPRGGGDFYFENEYAVPQGYGSDGQLMQFAICNKPDDELKEANQSINNYPPPSGITGVASYRERMFYWGDPAFPYRLYYSPIGQPGAVPPIYYKNLLGNIVGAVSEKDRLIVCTDETTYEVTASDFDYDEITAESATILGAPVLAQRLKSGMGCVAGRGMMVLDDIGAVFPTQRSIAMLEGTSMVPLSRYIDGFAEEDVPDENLTTSVDYRMIYPYALNMTMSSRWISVYDKFNDCYILFSTLNGETLGNRVALVWYPHYTLEGVSGEFGTYSFLESDSASAPGTDGIYVVDAREIRRDSSRLPEIWVLARNGYVYKLHSGQSDGVDYLCLEGTQYEKLNKSGNVSADNTTIVSLTPTTAPLLDYAHPRRWTSPLGSYDYMVRGRGVNADAIDPSTLLTALATYGITDPFIGAVIKFTKQTTTLYRTITAITTQAHLTDDFYYLVPTLNSPLPEQPDDEWSYEIGGIYSERVTGKGGIWPHNKIGRVLDIDIQQKVMDHGVGESDFTPEEIYAEYTAKEGSVASGYIIAAGALNPNFSDWARIRNLAEFNGNVANHPSGAFPGAATAYNAFGDYALLETQHKWAGHFSWYAGWPCVFGGVRGNRSVNVSHLYTDFEIWIPDDVATGAVNPSYGVVASMVEEPSHVFDTTHQTTFDDEWWEYRMYHFYYHRWLSNNIPVIVLRGINNTFESETGCATEASFVASCQFQYFEKGDELVFGQMNSAQLFGYMTGWDLLKYFINTRLAHGHTMSNMITYGQSLRGTTARRTALIHPEGKVCLNTASSIWDYGWYFQRHRKIANKGVGSWPSGLTKTEEDIMRTRKEFRDFYGLSPYAAYWKIKDKRCYHLLQLDDTYTVASEYGGPLNNFAEETKCFMGSNLDVEAHGVNRIEVTDLLTPGQSYTFDGNTYTFAGMFHFIVGSTDALSLRGDVAQTGGLHFSLGTQAEFGTAASTSIDANGQRYAAVLAGVGGPVGTVGYYFLTSGALILDRATMELALGETLDHVYITDYKLASDHWGSDINLRQLQNNYWVEEATYPASRKTEYVIQGLTFAWEKDNPTVPGTPDLEITVGLNFTFVASFTSLRVLVKKDDPSTFAADYLFEGGTQYVLDNPGVYNLAALPVTLTVPISSLGITDIDTDTDKLAIVVEAGGVKGGITWTESSRAHALNIYDLSEYENAFWLPDGYVKDADFTVLHGYEDMDLLTKTADADKTYYKIAKFGGNGRSFRWGVRTTSPDAPIEIYGDNIITFNDNAARSGPS